MTFTQVLACKRPQSYLRKQHGQGELEVHSVRVLGVVLRNYKYVGYLQFPYFFRILERSGRLISGHNRLDFEFQCICRAMFVTANVISYISIVGYACCILESFVKEQELQSRTEWIDRKSVV